MSTLTDEQLSDMIENADGMRCIDGEYRIEGRDLMNLARTLATRASEAAATNSRDYQNGYEQAMHDAGLGVFDGEHATAIKIVHTEAGRTLSKSDFDLCLRIAKRALGVREAAPVAVGDALEWYQVQVANCRKLTPEGDAARVALDRDGGQRAHAALASQAAPVTQDAQQEQKP